MTTTAEDDSGSGEQDQGATGLSRDYNGIGRVMVRLLNGEDL